ncbi:copper resistance CopC family protein [Microbacterium cremeum]|uniref:copper resistance CopC family protein n=1 Tax=Microbacterium cremeum TaxID=2782169 RepID=UPI001E39DAC6|nr:copper resistance CopC family protein [Microbacterium cremeum]
MLALGLRSFRLSRLVAVLAALVLAAVAVLAAASPARAHDELLGSDPAAGSTVDTLPADLRLTFSGAIASEPGASEVQVTDASGTPLTDGDPTAQDNVLTQPLGGTGGAASGTVTVLWKVVSSDGHPISGEFSFTVTGAAAPTATADPTPSETVVPTETTEPTTTPSAAPTAPAEDASDPTEAWPWILLAVLALLVVAAVVYLLVSRSRRERALAKDAAAPADSAPQPGSEPPADQ